MDGVLWAFAGDEGEEGVDGGDDGVHVEVGVVGADGEGVVFGAPAGVVGGVGGAHVGGAEDAVGEFLGGGGFPCGGGRFAADGPAVGLDLALAVFDCLDDEPAHGVHDCGGCARVDASGEGEEEAGGTGSTEVVPHPAGWSETVDVLVELLGIEVKGMTYAISSSGEWYRGSMGLVGLMRRSTSVPSADRLLLTSMRW